MPVCLVFHYGRATAFYRVYTVMGDGELAEGSVWEGFMAGHQYKLDNLCAVIDRNRLQISGNTEDVMGHDDLHERIRSFGWHVIDVKDGNDIDQLNAAFEEAKTVKGKPTAVIANTDVRWFLILQQSLDQMLCLMTVTWKVNSHIRDCRHSCDILCRMMAHSK